MTHNFRQYLASVLHPEMLLDLIRQSTPDFLTSIKIIESESNSMSTEIERLESAWSSRPM